MKLPTRIQRKRTKGYKTPPNTCYCGRGSKWGNPFKVGEVFYWFYLTGEKKELKTNLSASLRFYEHWLDTKIYAGHLDITELLKYDYLSCWCSLDQDCQVDIIIEKLK
jgi:hypothetical protein